ncbi:hypothetical protein J2793_001547 [Paraburkholderia caledonica]|uniref:Uncharacterized protein n=1 Tax=Paraburkholderia caledonica TaxID=134536 RepID=A0AB73I821_9BURK|nr:hypothetical protein [Paraburkholderia caledonica]
MPPGGGVPLHNASNFCAMQHYYALLDSSVRTGAYVAAPV